MPTLPPCLRGLCLRVLLICLPALIATSCQSGPYPATLLAQGGTDLNKTFNNEPSAVNIRILQLKKRDVFDSATDAELKSADLKDKPWVTSYSEAKVRVGKAREIEVMVQPEVLFLGIVGLFNEKDGDWRTVIDIDTLSSDKLVFDKYALSVQPREE